MYIPETCNTVVLYIAYFMWSDRWNIFIIHISLSVCSMRKASQNVHRRRRGGALHRHYMRILFKSKTLSPSTSRLRTCKKYRILYIKPGVIHTQQYNEIESNYVRKLDLVLWTAFCYTCALKMYIVQRI